MILVNPCSCLSLPNPPFSFFRVSVQKRNGACGYLQLNTFHATLQGTNKGVVAGRVGKFIEEREEEEMGSRKEY